VKFIESFIIAIRSIFANKLRSSLTMLGIIIGVGSVITLMSVGEGAQAMITSTFEQMGTNVLNVIPRSPEGAQSREGPGSGSGGGEGVLITPTLTLDDVKALEDVPSILALAPVNNNIAQVTFGGESKQARVYGSSPGYQKIGNYSVASGQFIAETNVASRDMVVVLGSEVAEELFGSDNPVGQKVKMKEQRFTVIGVLESKGGAMMEFSLDNLVITPITTYQAKLFSQQTARGENAVQTISIQAASSEVTDEITEDVQDVLRKRHHITDVAKDDFAVQDQAQQLDMVQQVFGIFTIVLSAIAGISLLVGSIGIMNIMLVSVTERTREIGIRKAVGAKRRDILVQFLLESAMLSLAGGIIGIIGGWLLSLLISLIDFGGITLQTVVSPTIIILAISVAVFIGLASGTYPALRAARMNPIDALHYE
jgi:putative ABC transport system permease protein